VTDSPGVVEVHRGEEVLRDRAVDEAADGRQARAGEDHVGPAARGAVGAVPALVVVVVVVCVCVCLWGVRLCGRTDWVQVPDGLFVSCGLVKLLRRFGRMMMAHVYV
jgi:hypothetical protein